MSKPERDGGPEHDGGGTVRKLLLPLAASAASAATAYAVRKATPFLREKLQELADGGMSERSAEALAKARDAVGERLGTAGSSASDLLGTDSEGETSGASQASTRARSPEEREERRRGREQARRERRQALRT